MKMTAQPSYRRPPLPDEEVRVHRNLNTGGWSVLARVPGRGWRVIARLTYVALRDVSFVCREGGAHRALRTGQRNVHAFAQGRWVEADPIPAGSEHGKWLRVRYTLGRGFHHEGSPLPGGRYFMGLADGRALLQPEN